ncbi:MAG: DUF3179 domain-containing protein [Gammaproteobacteria bacterium]|nr:MAG: DUF3179 domain-containing protein [Gammaproteobacteria bacterium]
MTQLLLSKAWPVRIVRIVILVGIGWWFAKDLVYAQLPVSLEWPNTDFDNTLVDLREILSGGPPKDGIPPIDDPKFDSVGEADKWLNPREPVAVVSIDGETRAYPIQILIWHEIVNDSIAGVPVSVTFCPLCNSTIVFDRRSDGEILDFGTTGRLRKSNLVMYDRQTESWWQQFDGKAIVGKKAGTVLDRVPASIVAYEDFRSAYPDSRVLSRRTGYSRAYGNNPYRGYDSIDDQPFLFFDPTDPRLPPMERALNVSIGNTHKLYPFSVFEKVPVINDQVEDMPVVVFSRRGTLSALDDSVIADSRQVPSATAYDRRLDGKVMSFEMRDGYVVDRQSGTRWNLFGTGIDGPLSGRQLEPAPGGVHFAFAWLAFNPESQIYQP